MAHLDRVRAERLMAEAGLDALLLLSPESFTYATGVSPGVATMWRRSGAVAVLVPADSGQSETAVVSDLFASTFRRESHICDMRESPLWVETTVLDGGLSDLSPEKAFRRAWVAAGRAEDFERPTTCDPNICYRHIADAPAERDLKHPAFNLRHIRQP
ncbi:aminopeptidase P family N-terminal domain-containing protein [Ovoidimarina sediminis]|uniref:aminopeptidase P family N-terminal domain-containing protein n=1 Tax=Ovoidimarina sediminis TaxID=3079856 RepID=UPI00290D1AC6|nr:aminopeptidase P family N-terminal domain-containing protein [Rhodophyticola sp. MJ-SS7]MDU8944697.1 aminopeptidase P family N-terminal domain-containing protein [Rhodophyticola sp. MJ-SS7]